MDLDTAQPIVRRRGNVGRLNRTSTVACRLAPRLSNSFFIGKASEPICRRTGLFIGFAPPHCIDRKVVYLEKKVVGNVNGFSW